MLKNPPMEKGKFVSFAVHTGERDTPHELEIQPRFMREMAMYQFCLSFVKGKKVVDLGCGEGYGAAYLASEAEKVIGIDTSHEAMTDAKRKYNLPNLCFEVMDVNYLQYYGDYFDVAISMAVIEHLKDYCRHINEAHRVLKGSGLFILGALNGSLSLGEDAFHYKEFSAEELRKLLQGRFSTVEIYGVEGKSETVIRYRENQRARVKKFMKWDVLRLHKRLPRSIYIPIYNFLQKRHRKKLLLGHEDEYVKITPQDFTIEKEKLEEAWNFICLAWK